MLLTPEKSTEIQNSIGADIIMQLDDVVSSTTTGDFAASIFLTVLFIQATVVLVNIHFLGQEMSCKGSQFLKFEPRKFHPGAVHVTLQGFV